MRIRTIHPGILDSESLNRVTIEAECVFYKLLSVVDDAGRARADVRLLANRAMPRRKEAEMMMPMWLDELEREDCLRRYRVEDVEYLHLVKWRKYQTIDRPTESKLPAPPKLASDSRAAREEIGKSLNSNEEEANSRAAREDFFGDDEAGESDEARKQKLDRALKHLFNRSTSKGSFTAALKSVELMGRKIGMWQPTTPAAAPAKAGPDSGGLSHLEAARAAQRPPTE